MAKRSWKQTVLAALRTLGRGFGIACFAIGSLFRSRSLRAMGLPCVAERNFRHGNFDAASARAVQLLKLAEAEPSDWNYGNAVHKAHLMLGRVALARGDLDMAATELLASARVPGSPQLATAVLFFLCVFWIAIWIIDFKYYNRLLLGAVDAIVDLEALSKQQTHVLYIDISTKIERAVAGESLLLSKEEQKRYSSLAFGRKAFYLIVFGALLVGLLFSLTRHLCL